MNNSSSAIAVKDLGKCFQSIVNSQSTLREKIYEIVGVSKKKNISSQPFWALRNINFEIAKGEVVGIIGANGAGKSTLLKLLAEIIEPTEGSIEFRGKVVSILEIGTGFHPDLTGIENIYLSGSLLRMTRAEIDSKLQAIAEFSELGDFLHRQVKYYSSGMFLRLAFSVCTHLEAEILLLDEVISVGDAAFSIKSLKRIREIAKAGRTIVLASHDLESVQHICTKCILLDKGSLVEMGDTSALVERYIEKGVFASLYKQKKDLSRTDLEGIDSISYLVSHKNFSTESGNENIRLQNLQVYASDNNRSMLQMTDSIVLECSFEKLVEGAATLSYIITYNMQTSVLSAAQLNNQNETAEDFNANGNYKVKCVFPASFFNHGIFSVGVFFTDANSNVLLQEENALIFKMEHSKISSGGLSYEGKYNGALYPKLNWQVEKK